MNKTSPLKTISSTLKRLEKNMATKKDVKRVDGRIDTIEKNMATKKDIKKIRYDLKDLSESITNLAETSPIHLNHYSFLPFSTP